MATTKVTKGVIADNAVGIDQLDVTDGSNGQVLSTDGSGTLSFTSVTSYSDSAVETYLDSGTSTPILANATFGGIILRDGSGSIGINRNPYNGNSVSDSNLQRFQINAPSSGSDFLDFQSYNSSGTYTGSFYLNAGKLGIGTSSPTDRLHVVGTSFLNGNTYVGSGGSGNIYLSAGTGIYMDGGTTSANLLDDYEEGTWTPSLNAGSFSSVNARYTKIGRVVTLTVDATVGTGGGSQISNIPFTAGNTTGTAIYTSGQDFNSGRTVPIVIVGGGSTTMYFRDIGDNVSYLGLALTAGAAISFTLTYDV